MRTEKETRELLDRVLSDERLGYEPANVIINAPLALIQLELETRRDILRWVLEESKGGG